ncbi:Peptidase A1 domain-containing protein [Aphelenchoides fujianensis]|nr:Peptidase A1 domain-containing protein [Aphelenchoides fujianensis]
MFTEALFFLFLLRSALVEGGTLSFRLRATKQPPTANGALGPLRDVFGQTAHSTHIDQRYLGEVSVGTPPKTFVLILWLPMIRCQSHGFREEERVLCSNRSTLYDPWSSSTAKWGQGSRKVDDGLRNPKLVRGRYFEDVVAFGNTSAGTALQLKKPAVFGAADQTFGLEQGILGLGLSTRFDKRKPIVEQAFKEGLLDRPLFSLFFKKCPKWELQCEDGGMVTLGGEDRKNCGPVLGWAPAFTDGGPWQFRVSRLTVGRFVHRKEAIVSSDSSAPRVYLPAEVLEGVVRAVNATGSGNSWIVDCDKKFELKFTINGRTFAKRRIGFALPKH